MQSNQLKVKLAQQVLSSKNKTLLKRVEAILSASEEDFWDELTDEQRESALKGRSDIKAGKIKTTKQVMAKYKKWLTK
ncbi:MAG: hypothetical protein MUE96_03505 [Bacteroidia bacterium]|jgi:hypothetical protein|nr:hypothetical protein [Bacteroidia bacterium]